MQDGAGEQDSEGYVRADEGGGHDGEGRRGGVGQRGEEGDEGPVRATRTRAARQSVQTRAQAWGSVIRRLPWPVCPSDDATRVCRVPGSFCHCW